MLLFTTHLKKNKSNVLYCIQLYIIFTIPWSVNHVNNIYNARMPLMSNFLILFQWSSVWTKFYRKNGMIIWSEYVFCSFFFCTVWYIFLHNLFAYRYNIFQNRLERFWTSLDSYNQCTKMTFIVLRNMSIGLRL